MGLKPEAVFGHSYIFPVWGEGQRMKVEVNKHVYFFLASIKKLNY
jgi:hypothetical protein